MISFVMFVRMLFVEFGHVTSEKGDSCILGHLEFESIVGASHENLFLLGVIRFSVELIY